MAPVNGVHHHENSTKSSHKPFKSRHATKGALKELSKGKISDGANSSRGSRRTPHQQIMSKLDRRNQARQKQQTKHQDRLKVTSVFSGRNGAPRIVSLVPLCEDIDIAAAIKQLNASVDILQDVHTTSRCRVQVDRFKQKLDYLSAKRNALSAMDSCRVADYVVLILSASQEVDELGETMIRALEGQGVSNVLAVVQGLEAIESVKRRGHVVTSLSSFINHFFPEQEKVISLSSRQECSNAVRSLCTSVPKGIRWRDERSWMLVEDVDWPGDSSVDQQAVVSGIIRGRSLKADRLVQLGDWGTFQIDKIVSAPLELRSKTKQNEMPVDPASETAILDKPSQDQDDLQELAPEEIVMEDAAPDPVDSGIGPPERKGVLLDDHHYFEDDESHIPPTPKRLPKGTSKYQAAWFLDDISDSGSDLEDAEDDLHDANTLSNTIAGPADGMEGLAGEAIDGTEAMSEAPQSEMFVDQSLDNEVDQLESFRAQRRKAADEDAEFPDEIELPPNALARERLARYRGLKSLKSSHWEASEDKAHEPEEWARLLHVNDYRGFKSQAARETLAGGVSAGTRVQVYLRNVPIDLKSKLSRNQSLGLFSLLRHEQKKTVVNASITLDSESPEPLKSKEEIIIQCGPRRFVINPLFSQPGYTPNNVHKFSRFLHPGQTEVTTFMAPLTWGSVPVLYFKRIIKDDSPSPADTMTDSISGKGQESLVLIGSGTNLPPDQDRVIAKRVVLTGHPYKIHKKLVTVRYMFFNAEDVNWFKALQLWTRRGRSGYIKESLGTHGYFKATFDGRINPQDAVGVSLYKRVFPRTARPFMP